MAIAGRKTGPLGEVADAIEAASGNRPLVVPTDVRDPVQTTRLIAEIISAFGRLDVLVNNAGKGWHAPLRTMTPAVWNNDIQLNLSAAFLCAQAALPYLEADGCGAIVNISSLAGMNGSVGVGAYSAAKAGLQMFTRVAAAEWGPRGVRVNAVAPGMIETPLATANWARTGFDARGASQPFPLRRPGRADEIAHAVVFLAKVQTHSAA